MNVMHIDISQNENKEMEKWFFSDPAQNKIPEFILHSGTYSISIPEIV